LNWRAAFLRQAASDEAVRRLLDHSGVERCHSLHYLQMVAEKVAKGLLATANDPRPPPTTHHALVRLLQIAKNRPDVRHRLGYRDAASFLALVNSLLPLAAKIEALAPSAAGVGQPNPEYPWRDAATATAVAPADHPFDDFDPRSPHMRKLATLIEQLARLPG
jgi:hypothetical protein